MVSVATDTVSQMTEGGDSKTAEERSRFEKFLSDLKAVKSASRPFTLILDDPLANSYVQNLYAPDPDPNMIVEWYERTWEQNEELGLNDMKVLLSLQLTTYCFIMHVWVRSADRG